MNNEENNEAASLRQVSSPSSVNPLAKRGRGRPKKSEIEAAKKRPVGRPKGDASAIEEFKARLIASPKSKLVFDSILDAALDDEHKNQAAAWKLLVDRLLPMSYFEKDKNGGGRPSVNITISGIGGHGANSAPLVNIGEGGEEEGDDSSQNDYIDV